MNRKKLDLRTVQKAAGVLRCISHPHRLRIVECLEDKRLPVGEIVRRLGAGQAEVSKHLGVMRRQGIVSSEVRGNFRYYAIAYPNVVHVLDCMRRHTGEKQ